VLPLRGIARRLTRSQSAEIFVYPHLGGTDLGFARILGTGLGNLLLPWARAIIAARRNRWTPLFPTWPQLKVGPLLRRERDARLYSGLFRCPPDYVGSPRRLLLLLRGPRVGEGVAVDRVAPGSVVVFRGLQDGFRSILEEHELVRRELLAMVRVEHLHHFRPKDPVAIGIHVRLGDFRQVSQPGVPEPGIASYGDRLPLDWYVEALGNLRRALGPVPALVFSDGSNSDLDALLRLPGVQRFDSGSPLGDLLALASVRVLIGSISTFSMWATYLGRMPTVWRRSEEPTALLYDRPGAEASVAPGDGLPEAFLALARAAIGPRE